MSLGAVVCGSLDRAQAARQDLYSATAYVGFTVAKQTAANYFFCDGVADDVTIEAAIAYIDGLGGGSLLIEDGTYVLAARIDIAAVDDLLIQGVGDETVIYRDDNVDTRCFQVDNCDRFVLRDLTIDGNRTNQTTQQYAINITGGSADVLIDNVRITSHLGIEINLYNAGNVTVSNCTIIDKDTSVAIASIGLGTDITTAKIINNDLEGQVTLRGTDILCSENTIHGGYWHSCIGVQEDGMQIIDNICEGAETNQAGIEVHSSENTIIGNHCHGGAGTGIEIRSETDETVSNNLVIGNKCEGNTQGGMRVNWVAGTLEDNQIVGNQILNNTGSGILLNAASVTRTTVKRNQFSGNSGSPLSDNGTDTILATFHIPFVDGTTFISADGSPWGWEIDADTEYAIALGHLPEELIFPLRWKIWAVSIVTEADAMRLEIVARGGASNQAYTTESVDIADKASTTTNFAANDVIYWTLTSADDPDIDDFRGADLIIVKVKHEAAGNGDCATDATFQSVEVEYV